MKRPVYFMYSVQYKPCANDHRRLQMSKTRMFTAIFDAIHFDTDNIYDSNQGMSFFTHCHFHMDFISFQLGKKIIVKYFFLKLKLKLVLVFD